MIKILFICHGNICRSPMAEFVLKDMVNKKGLSHEFLIESCATNREEIGNPVHRSSILKLNKKGIAHTPRKSVQLTVGDYQTYDLLICMDNKNMTNALKIVGEDKENKMKLLLSYTNKSRNIADPWYTGNYDETYEDIVKGCTGLLESLLD